jgi:segregation and condensation protein A
VTLPEVSPDAVPAGAGPGAGAPADVTAVGNQVAEPAADLAVGPVAEPAGGPAGEQAPVAEPAAEAAGEPGGTSRFQVTLTNFTGPFDLLLQLISKHKLDVTEVALHKVTDEFIAYIRAMGNDWDLDEASEFLVVAATLLDLKAARLLPAAAVEDEEDLALLEARDLLFARLLQYKAFKEAAAVLGTLSETGARRWPRAVRLEPQYAEALPDLVLGIGPHRLAELAARALAPKQPPVVSISHVHMVRVSVREHAAVLREKLMQARMATFRVLCADCQSTLEVVARFLALLELYRQGLVGFEQVEALGELTVRWIAAADAESDDIQVDEYAGARAEPEAGAEPVGEPERSSEAAAEPGFGPAPEPTDGGKRDE